MKASTPPRVVVIGGGLSGLAAAQRLAADGRTRVDVVEAGGRTAEDHMNATYSVPEIEDMWRVPGEDPTLWRPWDSLTPPHYAGASGLRRQLGGRSLYWHGVVLRMDPWALAAEPWPDGLLGDDQSLYASVEHDLASWAGRPLQASRSETEDRFLAWTGSLGYPHAERTPLAVQRFDTAAGPRWRAYSPLYAASGSAPAAPAVRDHGGIRISTGLRALAVTPTGAGPLLLLQDSRTGGVHKVTADAVILAAGTIENTRLVAQLLAERGGGPDRYTGLNDHILQGFVVHVARSAWGHRGGEGACLVVRGDAGTRSNLFLKLLDAPDPAGVILNIWEMGEQERSELNAVEFPRRTRTPWRATVRSGLTAADAAVVAGQRSRLQQSWEAAARALGLTAGRMDFGDFMTAPSDVAGFLDKAVAEPGTPVPYAATLGSIDHEGGTLPYGGLLDPSGQVTAAPGVFVAGPATFPRSGAANLSLTNLAVTRHVAREVESYLGH